MIFPVWRQQLVRSLHLHRSKAEAKYFQVASVGSDGSPKLRTMVFRGFEQNSNVLLATSDARSEKISEWTKLAKAELHWYFVKTREQYRIACDVSVIRQHADDSIVGARKEHSQVATDHTELYESVWKQLSKNAQQSFFCTPPKSTITDEFVPDEPKPTNISPYFALVCFIPVAVDYVDLKTVPHTRTIFTLNTHDNKWSSTAVNP